MRPPNSKAAPQRRWPAAEDAGLCALLIVGWVTSELLATVNWWLLLPAVLAVLFCRQRYPLAVAVLLLVIGQLTAGAADSTQVPWSERIAGAVAMFLLGQNIRSIKAVSATVGAVVLAKTVFFFAESPVHDAPAGIQTYIIAIFMSHVGAALAGRLSLQHRQLMAVALAKARAQAEAQTLLTERAACEERDRIARDMHDVIGHRVGNMVMLAAALEASLRGSRTADPADAVLIRTEGRAALQELRSVFHALESSAGGDVQGLADLTDLVRASERAMGTSVTLRVDGHPELLPAPVQLSIRRLVQEGLANAAKHAPGAEVTIDLVCARDGVHLAVLNTAPSLPPADDIPGGGTGLAGVRARVVALGGTFEAQELPEGGFRVGAWLPLRPPAAGGPAA
ncbi:histidine kinase [Streptomyces sp. NPDC048270]|uniref:sensor histidine kinase n=1 Tax=Streptomyces sp. NPDC048270 TaxID=3154615 RepID=UPI0033FC18C9